MFICVFCFFQLDIFVDVKTSYDLKWKLLSVSISGMSILVENWGYNSESWSDTLIKQFNNSIKITGTKTNINNLYSVASLHKISLILHSLRLGSHFGALGLKPVS